MATTSTSDIAYALNLTLYRGSTFDKTYTVKKNNADWDLSGMAGRLVIRPELGSDTETLVLTTASGLTFTNGGMRIVMTTAQTEAIASDNYVWDVIGKVGVVVSPIAKGRVKVVERVTDPDDIV